MRIPYFAIAITFSFFSWSIFANDSSYTPSEFKLVETRPAPPQPSPPNPESNQKREVKIAVSAPYKKLILDVEAGLLAGKTDTFVDCWDVQTGALIRRISSPSTQGGMYAAFHNLGYGNLFVGWAMGQKLGGSVGIIHANANEAIYEEERSNHTSSGMIVPHGSMSLPHLGIVAHLDDPYPTTHGLRLHLWKRGETLKTFEANFDGGDSLCWGLSNDGSTLLMEFGQWDRKKVQPSPLGKFHLAWYSLETGKRIAELKLPDSYQGGQAICGTEKPDEFYVLEGGELKRYSAQAGLVPENNPTVLHPQYGQSSWLERTEPGWCLYGLVHQDPEGTFYYDQSTSPVGLVPVTESTPKDLRFRSFVQVSENAPDSVRQLVATWDSVRTVGVDPSGDFAAIHTISGAIELYHLPSKQLIRSFGKTGSSRFSSFSSSGSMLTFLDSNVPGKAPFLRTLDLTRLKGVEKELEYLDNGESFLGTASGGSFQHAAIRRLWDPSSMNRVVDYGTYSALSPEKLQSLRLESFVSDSGSLSSALMAEDFESLEVYRAFTYREILSFTAERAGKRVGIAYNALNGTQLAEFSMEPFGPGAFLGDYHAESQRGLIIHGSMNDEVTLVEASPSQPAIASWNVEDATMQAGLRTIQFGHHGERAIGISRLKRTDQPVVFELSQPGAPSWSNYESISMAQFTADDQHILTANRRGELVLYEASREKEIASHPISGYCVSINDDATLAYVKTWDNLGYDIIRISEGEFTNVARFLPGAEGAYVILLANGYYMTQGDALNSISYNSGTSSQPAESLDLYYNRPDLVARALGSPPSLIAALERAYQKRLERLGITQSELESGSLPPRLSIDYRSAPVTTTNPVLPLPVSVSACNSPLAAIEVFINDVPLFGRDGLTLSVEEQNETEHELNLQLSEGNNKITLWARDTKGLTSSRNSVNVNYQPESPVEPDLYVLSIGVNDYENDTYDLALAAKDAEDISNAFATQSTDFFQEVHTLTITDSEASREGILGKASAFLGQAGIEDSVLVFLAGHGVLDSDYEYRFCCSDLDVERIPDTTLTYRELEGFFDQCQSRRRILMLDTCHAGEADRDDDRLASIGVVPNENVRSVPFQGVVIPTEKTGDLRVTDLLRDHFVDLRVGIGAAVLASSNAHQVAIETSEINNGLFTASVLQGLKQGGADLDQDGSVRVSELIDYCRKEVRALSGNLQEPVARQINRSQDFILTRH